MSNTISKYVGTFVDLSDGYKKIYGNCFFINSYTVVTALHVIERLEKNRFAMLYKGKERVVDPDRIERYEQYDLAIIWFDEDIVDTFNNHYLFDIKEDIGNESVDWKMEGYLPIGNGSKLLSISGNQSYLDSPTKIVFSEVNELHYDLRGMSGSPVCINDLIVGVITDQKTVDNVVKEVIITPIKLIADRIDKALIGENIFSHKLTPKINYAVELQDYFKRDKYFERRCRQYDGVDYIANGNLGEELAQTDNKIIKNYLSKIAIAMHYMGKNIISDGDFNIIATKIDDHPRIKVLEKCGLIGLDAFGNRYFVHKNFFEFLPESVKLNIRQIYLSIQDTPVPMRCFC